MIESAIFGIGAIYAVYSVAHASLRIAWIDLSVYFIKKLVVRAWIRERGTPSELLNSYSAPFSFINFLIHFFLSLLFVLMASQHLRSLKVSTEWHPLVNAGVVVMGAMSMSFLMIRKSARLNAYYSRRPSFIPDQMTGSLKYDLISTFICTVIFLLVLDTGIGGLPSEITNIVSQPVPLLMGISGGKYLLWVIGVWGVTFILKDLFEGLRLVIFVMWGDALAQSRQD